MAIHFAFSHRQTFRFSFAHTPWQSSMQAIKTLDTEPSYIGNIMSHDTPSNNGLQNDELIQSFLTSLSHPEQELLPLFVSSSFTQQQQQQQQQVQEKRRLLQQVCQVLFQQVEHLARLQHCLEKAKSPETYSSTSVLSGLHEMFVNDTTDAETLWGQAELQNEALLTLLKKNVKKLYKAVDSSDEQSLRLLDMGDIMSDDAQDDLISDEEDDDDDDGSSSEDDGEKGEDDETKRIRQRMERAMQDMEEDSDDDLQDEHDAQDAPSSSNKNGDEESLEDPAAEELNDGFFDIHEMEAFADEEEEYLPQDAFGTVRPEKDSEDEDEPKKSFHQRQREGNVDNEESGSDSDKDDELAFKAVENTVKRRKYRQDSEIEALYKLYQEAPQDDGEDEDDDDDVVNMTAADFFGKPNKKYYEKYYSRKQQPKEALPKVDANDDDDADSWDDHDFNDEGPGWRDEGELSSTKKVRFGENQVQEYDNEVGEDEEEGDGMEDEEAPANAPSSSSAHARHTEKLRRQTEQLEKELLAEKPWQMTGESKGTSRPVNSLLEETPEFEVATKMAPLITVEHTANLEEVIKQRILNEDWDDVVPRELPDVAWNKKRGELPEVSQEKSKLGLGELYEREYLKKAAGYDVDAAEKQSDEEKARSEMKALFANLCSKLDALSNYHFAPRPVADEAEVRAVTTPAIAMEEILPLHVSDARGVAPEEVYGKKKGRDGILRGETELDQAERKRLRNAKKAARRKARKAKLADEKLISRLEPGLGLNNPYEKRKMREELSMARSRGKITVGERDTNADYGASGKFFKRMQEEVEQDILGDGNDAKKRKLNDEGSNRKSSSFKL